MDIDIDVKLISDKDRYSHGHDLVTVGILSPVSASPKWQGCKAYTYVYMCLCVCVCVSITARSTVASTVRFC
jgi:hypothetical protein